MNDNKLFITDLVQYLIMIYNKLVLSESEYFYSSRVGNEQIELELAALISVEAFEVPHCKVWSAAKCWMPEKEQKLLK